ncbi:MAG: xanthine dehydrogenase family protein subunit M [Halanaerobium sp.]|nr:xanthine dehydrogenase family protein subunit M [Halanaerobium sp.]
MFIKPLDYYQAGSIEEAIDLLSSKEGKTSLVAGGTDLMVDMKKGFYQPDNVIDIKGIAELAKIELTDKGLFLGATVTCNQVIESEVVQENYPLLVAAARRIASHQIRNRATLVGNLCTASPGADSAPSLLVLGTTVLVQGPEGKREIRLEEFFTGVKKNALEQGEIVTGLLVDRHAADGRGQYMKKARIKGPDLSAAGVAGFLSKEEGILRFAFGALAPTPKLLDASSLFFAEGDFAAKKESLLQLVDETINPITDVRSTREYRMRVAKIYTERILNQLWKEGEM